MRKRLLLRVANRVISGGGILMILSLALIFVLIVGESLPLFRGARASISSTANVEGAPVLAAENEYRGAGYAVFSDGAIRVFDVANGRTRQQLTLPGAEGKAITGAFRSLSGDDFLSVSDGSLLIARPEWQTTYERESRSVALSYDVRKKLPAGRAGALVSGGCRDAGCAAVVSPDPETLPRFRWST